MNILFTASECFPFLKTGGLGDVAYALPKALRKIGIDARVILPKYGAMSDYFKNNMHHIQSFDVPVGWRKKFCGLEYIQHDSVPFYFIDNEYYFYREGAYGYYDDAERFAFFSRAVLEAIHYMGDFTPNIIHCNDWQTGMIPVMLKDIFRFSPRHNNIKTIYTIHNLKYQGVFDKNILAELLCLNTGYFHEDALKFYDGISFMKGGIKFSDKVSTVSNSYAGEIQTPFYGEGLDGLLRSKNWDLWGILNGIDFDVYNPAFDKDIFAHYDKNYYGNKYINKSELQKMLNLPVNNNIPIIGIVSRLVDQKGFDLIAYMLEELLQDGIQIVVLGTGDRRYEDIFKYFAYKYPNKLSANITFSNSLAQKIYAGSDMFLMPSLFEPCGIGQLISLRYGTIPIVRETGGLRDTVFSYNDDTGEGNGFTFANYNAQDMLHTIRRAEYFFYNRKDIWNSLILRGMWQDNSWNNSAYKYSELYNSLF
ncbi:glycogen synthase [Clostridium pasteurianum DSM 525 = ATCC 6013]|uniref:Glycogen synthase n=1 Tax=Clostridium pasteurianum DSM 525 = ATCC 6013 TaxID=1262449 RepID=A0A0H3J441_CLOPA|nr:glycogen synthase GlgA [Clostridium pasteurianum]AJA48244.1 glycogen synthase [Clostridium pasteurianum DSM 525 = ATCC 6013]AJA52232.1 glycogen synthase [Clostridium pasteurianum DSM 525 = ATCC 6013]AOZ75500.1 glycogen synthase [Clostridium pasteurianum DSM 525 = ATCC 6013]AOZ79295.1 glycogen synthase [Clostridium pasteurianum]ELP60606.1 glycogen synthase [Clostridium pasteurianum DSM 525 = ATCC 6013]